MNYHKKYNQGNSQLTVDRRSFLKTSLISGVSFFSMPLLAGNIPVDKSYRNSYHLSLDSPTHLFDGKNCWSHPRAGVVLNAGNNGLPQIVMTMNKLDLSGSDVFRGMYEMSTADFGKKWTSSKEIISLAPRYETIAGVKRPVAVSDFWPCWHKASKTLLGIGHTVVYTPDWKVRNPRPRNTSYAVYDANSGNWNKWKKLEMPDRDKFNNSGAGCVQPFDMKDGTILLPISFRPSGENFRTTVCRCSFDGEKLNYLEHGTELELNDEARGLYEFSLAHLKGNYFLTLRNDKKGFVACSKGGLHFNKYEPWIFDDGTELGSYNTQQHWVTHSNGMFLAYTRRGAGNDHVFRYRPDKPYERWLKLKKEHTEYLFGKVGEMLPHERWSAVDFSHPEIRNLCVQYYSEVFENYDVDDIERDFFRYLFLFGNLAGGEVATKEQLDMLIGMLTQIREMTERVGMKKGKPILVLARVPDSFEYCGGVGIDLENWLKKGLVDIIVGSGYFRLNPWKYFVEGVHQYRVKVYVSLSEPRVKKEHPLLQRLQNSVYHARSAAAWQAGVDGLYIFNEYNTRSQYLSEIGSANKLKNKNNLYFVSYRNANPASYLINGNSYSTLPLLTSSNPVTLDSKPVTMSLELGDENMPGKVVLILYTREGRRRPLSITASLNGSPLKYQKGTRDGLSVFDVPQESVKIGINDLTLNYQGAESISLLDAAVLFYRNREDQVAKELATICFND